MANNNMPFNGRRFQDPDFHLYDQSRWWQIDSFCSAVAIFLSILVLAGGSWYFFFLGDNEDNSVDLPIILASAGPTKVRPDNAGQTNVPHQDKLVYDRLNPSKKNEIAEGKILPPTEDPIKVASANVGSMIESAKRSQLPPRSEMYLEEPVKTIDIVEDTTLVAVEPAVEQKHPQTIITSPGELKSGEVYIPRQSAIDKWQTIAANSLAKEQTDNKDEDVKDATSTGSNKNPSTMLALSAPTAVNVNDTTNVALQSPKKQGSYRVQVASLSSSSEAKNEWARLQSINQSLLSDQTYEIRRVDLGKNKGVYYHLLIGGFTDEAQAKNFCYKVKGIGKDSLCVIASNK